MGKRKSREDSEIIEDSFLKKVRFDETISTNGYHVNGNTSDLEGIDVWLVRKPKTLLIDELQNMTFPKKIKPSNCEKTVTTTQGVMECELGEPSKSMFFFEAPETRSERNPKLPLRKKVKGIAWIKLPVEVDDPFPQAKEEDFDLMDIKMEDEDIIQVPFKVKSIRKRPDCQLTSKERLKAFGAIESTEIGSRKKEKLKKIKREFC